MAPLAKVLVVDDDQPTREFIVEVLEDEGYLVRAANDAEHALAAAEAEHFDVILLDLRMPGTNGAELFQLLYERALATMPVILMTADNNATQGLIGQGVKYILLKPFDLNTLLNCVAEALHTPQGTHEQGVPTEERTTIPQDVHICS